MAQRVGSDAFSADTHTRAPTPAASPSGDVKDSRPAALPGVSPHSTVVACDQLVGLVKPAWLADRRRVSDTAVSVPTDFTVEVLAGIGPQRAARLHAAGIATVRRMLRAGAVCWGCVALCGLSAAR